MLTIVWNAPSLTEEFHSGQKKEILNICLVLYSGFARSFSTCRNYVCFLLIFLPTQGTMRERPEKNWAQCLVDDLRIFRATEGSTESVPLVLGVETVLWPTAAKKGGKWCARQQKTTNVGQA